MTTFLLASLAYVFIGAAFFIAYGEIHPREPRSVLVAVSLLWPLAVLARLFFLLGKPR